MTKHTVDTITIGQNFATRGVVRDARTGKIVAEATIDRPYGYHSAARNDAREAAARDSLALIDDVVVRMNCRAFQGRMGSHRVQISEDGSVRVYDTVAGHYTKCHDLSARDITRAKKLATAE